MAFQQPLEENFRGLIPIPVNRLLSPPFQAGSVLGFCGIIPKSDIEVEIYSRRMDLCMPRSSQGILGNIQPPFSCTEYRFHDLDDIGRAYLWVLHPILKSHFELILIM